MTLSLTTVECETCLFMSIYSFKTFQFKCLSDFIDEKQNNTEYWTEIWIWEKPLFDPDQQLQKQNPFFQGKFYSILEALILPF